MKCMPQAMKSSSPLPRLLPFSGRPSTSSFRSFKKWLKVIPAGALSAFQSRRTGLVDLTCQGVDGTQEARQVDEASDRRRAPMLIDIQVSPLATVRVAAKVHG